jgi:hypothetical protein
VHEGLAHVCVRHGRSLDELDDADEPCRPLLSLSHECCAQTPRIARAWAPFGSLLSGKKALAFNSLHG